MKSIVPWFCLVAVASIDNLYAADGLEAYRQGNYPFAAQSLKEMQTKDPVVDYYMGRMRLYGYGELKNNAMALRYFTEAGNKGYLPAQEFLARYYLLHAQNPAEAFNWFKKAADADNTAAQMYCAAAYLFGYGVKKNPDLARRYYIEAAKNGNSIAQLTLANQFLDSRDSRNKKLGLIWLMKAAEQNNLKAQMTLGELYVQGGVVPKDLVKAKELISKAAQDNNSDAWVALGNIARKQTNWLEAKDWYTKAAEAKNVKAEFELAKLYLDAANPNHNDQDAFGWMQKAAQAGLIDAQKALALMYKKGQGVAANENLAQQWQLAAEKPRKEDSRAAELEAIHWLSNDKAENFPASGYQLSGIYTAWQNPQALKENNYNAAPQMNKLSRKDLYKPQFVMVQPKNIPINDYFDILAPMLSSAQTNDWSFIRYPIDKQIDAVQRHQSYVLRHKTGTSVIDDGAFYFLPDDDNPADYLGQLTKDWRYQANLQAVLTKLYNQAILGDPGSQFEIGQLYQYGIGVSKNIGQAITYYQLAAAQQDIRAEYNLGVIYLEGKTDPVDYKKGIEWMTDAAFKGNANAQYALANIYEKGLTDPSGNEVIKPNHQQAMAMYYLASANHLGEAQYRLADYLVKEKQMGLSVGAKTNRLNLIKRLYQGAANEGIADAVLPLAFYNAMDADKSKQNLAFDTARKEAKAGNPEAALLLGIMFERGIAVPPNEVEALYWYQQAAMNPVSEFILGTYYTEGKGLAKDINKGRSLLQQSADAGFSYANLNLGILKHDMDEYFLSELDTARQQGNSKAGLLLADYYLQQANDPDKMKQGQEIYQYFAEKGDKDAQVKLGFLYDRGLAGTANNEEAARWYQLAAEQGQPIAQYLLGQLYQLGRIGTAPDYAMAKKWYQEAQKTYPLASVALGFIFDTVEDDYVHAAENYLAAANANDPIGQYDLGLIYENGKGVPVDLSKAQLYYQQAADKNYARAMTQLAGLYFNGIAGARDQQKALQWYKKAAALGDGAAMYQLGLLSETGVATKLDYSNAVNYYQQASDLGNEKAQMALARMYQYGLGVEKDLNHAADIYKQLAQNNNAYAQYQLAMIYMDGLVGEQSLDQAKTLLQQASTNGSKQAGRFLEWMNAQQESKLSFIEPISTHPLPSLAGQSAELMYMEALNEWNRGDEALSRLILDKLMAEFPHYTPAKKAYEQINQKAKAASVNKNYNT